MNFLIVVRFFQALGACSGQVIARAIVRDLFEPREAVQVFSLLVLVMGVSPVLAPLVGGQILQLVSLARHLLGDALSWERRALAGSVLRLRRNAQGERKPLVLASVLRTYGNC